jgi:UMF1 family MFS transporter
VAHVDIGGDHRLALMITGVYFAIGIAIVVRIDVARGRLLALAGAPGAT